MGDCTDCRYKDNMCKWPCDDCVKGDKWEEMPFTNADRIRAMTDEELAEWIIKHDCHTLLYGYDRKDAVLDWLKQEVKE